MNTVVVAVLGLIVFLGGGSNTWVGDESAADSLDAGCSCSNTDEVQGKMAYEQMVFFNTFE